MPVPHSHTTHSRLTVEALAAQQITPGTIRLSAGTEHIDDLLADLEAGFRAVTHEAERAQS